jgi:hypothetical protein
MQVEAAERTHASGEQSGPSSQARLSAAIWTPSKRDEGGLSGGKAHRADLPTDLTSYPMSALATE